MLRVVAELSVEYVCISFIRRSVFDTAAQIFESLTASSTTHHAPTPKFHVRCCICDFNPLHGAFALRLQSEQQERALTLHNSVHSTHTTRTLTVALTHPRTYTQSHTGTVINQMYIVVTRPHIAPPVLHTRLLLVSSRLAEFVLQSEPLPPQSTCDVTYE